MAASLTPWLDVGRAICSDLPAASSREWLVTNGLGSFASGTIAGMLTRRYHGLLIAALDPPQARTLLVAKLEEIVRDGTSTYELGTNRWAGGTIAPTGYLHLERFHLEGTVPVWTYALGEALLEKRVWMQPGVNTTYVRYTARRATRALHLSLKALVNYRDFHGTTHGDDWTMHIDPVMHGLRVTAFDEATPFVLMCKDAEIQLAHAWYRGVQLSTEAYRGLDVAEDHLHAGSFELTLEPGASATIVLSTETNPELDGDRALAERRAYENDLLAQAPLPDTPPEVQHLVLAADQFVVDREASGADRGKSVIAGYPWFGDWGRDTMIALPGLTLATDRAEVAATILRTFAHFVNEGMLPNRFPDVGEEPEYNTVDATLWYVEAIRAYHQATGDDDLVRDLLPTLRDIIGWHQRGTRYQIHVDEEDGLLYAGEPGVQLTWMDAKVGDWVVTPRIGKPVEINALWYNALRTMAAFIRHLGEKGESAFEQQARQVKRSFARFWNDERGYCFDVLDGPHGDEASLRPNQLFAVSLAHSPLPLDQQKAVVDACAAHLLTSHGLRSLAPGDAAYVGHYGGSPYERDGAYHQGTVWGWLIGPFADAHLRVYGDPATTRSFLLPLLRHLHGACVGSMSEIFDGDAPFAPRGAIAQAWTVAEVLRMWRKTGNVLYSASLKKLD